MNNNVTNNSDLKGCFWNPESEHFSCVVFHNSKVFSTSECKDYCPKGCSENYWKCNDLCIPVSQLCDGKCMSYHSYKCKDTCVPVNRPCDGICNSEKQVSCNEFCLDIEKEQNWIAKFGCEGKKHN